MYGPQNALMQWRRIIAETQERFEGHTPFTPHKKHICLLGGLFPINPTRRRVRLDFNLTLGAHFCQRRSWSGWLLCVARSPGGVENETLAYHISLESSFKEETTLHTQTTY